MEDRVENEIWEVNRSMGQSDKKKGKMAKERNEQIENIL